MAQSNEVSSALLLLVCWLILWFYTPGMLRELSAFMSGILRRSMDYRIGPGNISTFMVETITFGIFLLAPLFLGAVVIGIFSNLLQTGFLFTGETIKPRLDRLNPIEGAKRILSKRALVEMLKASLKLVALGYTVYGVIRSHFDRLLMLNHIPYREGMRLVGEVTVQITLRASLVLLVLAVLDYIYQRWEHEQSLKMTRQELKEERKQTEGDPELRRRIKERQRQMARQRMMQEVPEADVVVTNPTSLAVALKYDQETMSAPVVVAKGERKVAVRIREIAEENGVPVVEDRPLCRMLFSSTEIGDQIPYELYRAVAEVLAFVYRIGSGS